MKNITAGLARSQLKNNRKRTVITIVGIVLSVAMMTAVFGFAVSGIEAMRRLVGDQRIADYRSVLVSLAAVLGAIIMAASVVVISNAFRISAAERMRQFGILKSVGATGRQIVKTVLYEAAYLAAVSIPAGVIVGLLIQWLGASIGDALLVPMNKLLNNGLSIHMNFEFSWPVICLSVALSLATVLLSAWLPARKAARIPAIEAIRLTQEIKVHKGRLRTSTPVQLLFGFEGTLAAKAIKRSRRSYRAMVAALAISIILFLVCGGLETQLTMTMNDAYNNIDANTLTTYFADPGSGAPNRMPLDAEAAERVTDALRAYPGTAVYGVGIDDSYEIDVQNTDLTKSMLESLEPGQTRVGAVLVTLDRAHYEELCRSAGVATGSNILINSTRKLLGGKRTEFQPLRYHGQTLILQNGETELRLPLHAQITGADVPQEIAFAATEDVVVVVPKCGARLYHWFGASTDVEGYVAYAEETMRTFFPAPEGAQNAQIYNVMNVSAVTDMTRGVTRLITVFLYGFVGMLTLIGLTSVTSAISANVRLRAREFATLASVGMTQGGIRRMLALESVLSAFKALLYGLPIGSVAMYLAHLALTQRDGFQFVFPWITLLEAAAGVFVIALITTQYAAAKLRGGSIMEMIRATEGV